MTHDELTELSRRLFASAQIDCPSDELRARVLAAARVRDASSISDREQRGTALQQPSATKRGSVQRAVRWLLAAAVLVALPLVWRRLSAPKADEPMITAEKEAQNGKASAALQRSIPRSMQAQEQAPQARNDRAAPAGAPPPLAPPTPQPSIARPKPAATQPLASTETTLEAAARPAPSAATPAAASAAPSATLAQELESLQRARSLLRAGDSPGALRLLDAYTTELRGSDLSAEATVLRIEALTAVGRGAEASALARRFIAENPNSPLVDRAQNLLLQAEKISPRREQPAP